MVALLLVSWFGLGTEEVWDCCGCGEEKGLIGCCVDGELFFVDVDSNAIAPFFLSWFFLVKETSREKGGNSMGLIFEARKFSPS